MVILYESSLRHISLQVDTNRFLTGFKIKCNHSFIRFISIMGKTIAIFFIGKEPVHLIRKYYADIERLENMLN